MIANKEGCEDINSLQSVLLRGCEVSSNENGSAQGFNLGDENENSDDYKERENLSCLRLHAVYLVINCNLGQLNITSVSFLVGNP